MKITVIGGVNADVSGISLKPVRKADSNPAHIHMNAGGVGRNIAENLLRLGARVIFVSAVGDDLFAEFLRERFAVSGLDASRLVVREGMGTGLYILLLEPAGELFAAVNSMEAVESITPADLENIRGDALASDLVILDANLLPETLDAAARLADGVPLMADTVSAEKAGRVEGILPRLSLLKTNRAEAAVLAGFPLDTEEALREGCRRLLSSGLGEIFVTLGARGVFCASGEGMFMLPALPARTVNVNGAGDAFAAGAAWRYCLGGASGISGGRGAAARGLFGTAAAAITVECAGAVCENITAGKIYERLGSLSKSGENNEFL
ncbi:MAG: PfkB family carbohydrate kinase [Treponema sp.]|jgi:pseudouridine kinase|nr:PfkB family carbohydrate kinase [Treponema sp.]